jgi:hypothetical protein
MTAGAMDEETTQQLENLRRERQAHVRRLAILKERRATFGPREVPPYILTDIDDTDRTIVEIDAAIAKLLGRSLRLEERSAVVADAEPNSAVRRLWEYIFSIEDDLRRQLGALLLANAQRADTDDSARQRRQRFLDLFYFAVFVMLAAIVYKVWQ